MAPKHKHEHVPQVRAEDLVDGPDELTEEQWRQVFSPEEDRKFEQFFAALVNE